MAGDIEEKPKKRFRKAGLVVILIASISVMTGLIAGGSLWRHKQASPIPKSIRSSVNFPIYYPDQNQMPKGYSLEKDSFTKPQQDVVSYKIIGKNGKFIVTNQQPPGDTDIQNFYTNYIPLRNQVRTSHGTAEIGAYNTKDATLTVVSLIMPDNKSWVIITAPYDTSEGSIKDILNSLKSD